MIARYTRLAIALCFVLSGCQPDSATSPHVTTGADASLITSVTYSAEVDIDGYVEDDIEIADDLVVEESTPASSEPPADAVPVARKPSGKTHLITFDDLKIDMEKDTVFDPSMLTERVKSLDGEIVRIRGFIYPSIFQAEGITDFPMVMNTECKFGPGGQAHHIIRIKMEPGHSTSYTVRPILVEGLLAVRPLEGPDGNTWALYEMTDGRVK
jgi:hypothetical protein